MAGPVRGGAKDTLTALSTGRARHCCAQALRAGILRRRNFLRMTGEDETESSTDEVSGVGSG